MLDDTHKDLVYVHDCYCLGDGISRPTLTIGRPAFPSVVPVPFFWIPPPPSTSITAQVTIVTDVYWTSPTLWYDYHTFVFVQGILQSDEGPFSVEVFTAEFCP